MKQHWILALLALVAAACVPQPGPIDIITEQGCDPLAPGYCLFPYPSDAFLEEADTATGYRLAFGERTLPANVDGVAIDPHIFDRLDGYSPLSQIMTLFPRVPDLDGVAGHQSIDRSLEPDSPTVLLDLETGERLPHWIELDALSDAGDQTAVYVRTAGRLQEDRAYAVGFTGLLDFVGEPLSVSPAFAALRDDVITTDEALEARRPDAERMFTALETAGYARADLQLAWRFHTISGDVLRRDMLAMRADALERLGPDGIGCTVHAVDDDYGDDGLTWRRVRGTYTVPLYTDSPAPPTLLVRGDDGLPIYSGQDHEVPFTIIVPASLVAGPEPPEPAPLVTFGHGLMGEGEGTVSYWRLRTIANEAGMLLVATDWAGMSVPDATTVGNVLADASGFPYVAERLHQGMINKIALTRTFAGVCSDLPELRFDGVDLVDPEQRFYVGASQGGILGGTLMTLSPDIDRGVLLVNGVTFSFMMDRSTAFSPFVGLFETWYPERIDRAALLPVAQLLWDLAEPTGWLHLALEDHEGLPAKQILSLVAYNDAQVPNLSSDLAARVAGLPQLDASVYTAWGTEQRAGGWNGSGYVVMNVGDRAVPTGNEPPGQDDGGHDTVGMTPEGINLIDTFLRTGEVIDPCGGDCDLGNVVGAPE